MHSFHVSFCNNNKTFRMRVDGHHGSLHHGSLTTAVLMRREAASTPSSGENLEVTALRTCKAITSGFSLKEEGALPATALRPNSFSYGGVFAGQGTGVRCYHSRHSLPRGEPRSDLRLARPFSPAEKVLAVMCLLFLLLWRTPSKEKEQECKTSSITRVEQS